MRVDNIEGVDDGAFNKGLRFSIDDRGSFAEVSTGLCRFGIAHNFRLGTLRGLHFRSDGAYGKAVICTRGSVFDVLVDTRLGSPTHRQWTSRVLRPGQGLFLSPGIAHGYITLTDDAALAYMLGDPADDCGLRWDDPALVIEWPIAPVLISAKDRAWELLKYDA